jgi:hypothetical protein
VYRIFKCDQCRRGVCIVCILVDDGATWWMCHHCATHNGSDVRTARESATLEPGGVTQIRSLCVACTGSCTESRSVLYEIEEECHDVSRQVGGNI